MSTLSQNLFGRNVSAEEFRTACDTLVSRQRELQHANAGLRERVDSLEQEVDRLRRMCRQLEDAVADLQRRPAAAAPAAHAAAATQAAKPGQPPVQPPAPKAVEMTFYAYPYESTGIEEADASDADRAPLLARVKGDTGTVDINPRAVAYCLSRLDSTIAPYYSCRITNAKSPGIIQSDGPVKIRREQDREWRLERPLNLTIS